jgi:phenylalanine-4-hydroxylase
MKLIQAPTDFTINQRYAEYTLADQRTWCFLYKRQRTLAKAMGCDEFNDSLARLENAMNFDTAIPDLVKVNQLLTPQTGWKLVAVPGLIPDRDFFKFLSERQFPVTVWIRTPEEIDYIVEPDLFHDFFGHVPMLFDVAMANFLADYGARAFRANPTELTALARLYWYTIEYGLVAQKDGHKAFGAGLLSSASELKHAMQSVSLQKPYDLAQIRRTSYLIDNFQIHYFVLPSLAALI